MKKTVVKSMLILLLCTVVQAQPIPDFQGIMNTLQTKLDGVTVSAWTHGTITDPIPVWQRVVSNGAQPFAQQAASFPGFDHTGNGIEDAAHLALLQQVLEGNSCTRDLLGNAFVDNVREAFFTNRSNVQNREAKFTLRLHGDSRIDLNYIISASNRPVWTDPHNQSITTGSSNSLRICVDSGILIVGTTCLAESVDIPSLWGNDGLLNEGAPGLGDDLSDLLAAYLTLGDQAKVDYLQSLLYQTLCRGVLGNVMELVLSMLGKGVPLEYEPEPWIAPLGYDKSAKAYNAPNIGNHEINDVYDPPLVVSASDPYIAIRRVRATVYGASPGGGLPGMQEGVGQFWTNWYQVGANGFHPGVATRLTAHTRLNPGMPYTHNRDAWLASANLHEFLVNTGCDLNDLFIVTQPIEPATAISTSEHTLSLEMEYPHMEYTYTWYHGATPGALVPMSPPVNSNVLHLMGLSEGTGYYACEVTHVCTAAPAVSDTVSITYIPFVFTKQPPEQIYITTDENEVYADLVEAEVFDESPVTYQWYRKVIGETEFEAYGGPSQVLSFSPAQPTDAGLYYCRATSDHHGHSIDSTQMFVFVTGVSLRIYDALAGLGPQGTLSVSSGNISINTNARTLQTDSQTFFGEEDAGVTVFRFHEVNVDSAVFVTVLGSRPLSITAAGDFNWYADIAVAPGTLGGGVGGEGRQGGKSGGGGGSPGTVPGSGGQGGGGGTRPGEGQTGGTGGQGNPGTDGNAGNNGTAGEAGLSGLDGSLGYGAGAGTGFAGAGGAAGSAGAAGTGGGELGGGNPGYDNRGAGSAGAHRQPTTAGWNGAVGGGGGAGADGHDGGSGQPGGDGGNASFQARSDDMTLAAGHGGGGGGGGGKGGGGKGGGAGGGAQGGGGGGGAGGITSDAGGYVCGWGGSVGYSGGAGGKGGDGGVGGSGGAALSAGDGGDGGDGGGAVIFAARGVLRHGASTNVSASARTLGTAGAAAQAGVSGAAGGGATGGSAGESGDRHGYQAYGMFCGNTMRWYVGDNASDAGTRRGGHGAVGGTGGKGGDGGDSGSSGKGGDGGFGTPGMVKYMGSVAQTSSSQVVAHHGASADPEHSGRTTLISNMNTDAVAANLPQTDGHVLAGSLVGGDSAPVLRGFNPFVGVVTPFIGEMDSTDGHAATRGWLRPGYWNAPLVAPAFGTDNGVEYRILTGAQSIYEGYDQLLVKNTNSSGELHNVMIRVNGGTAVPIAGAKYDAGALAAGQVWTMSMPAATAIVAGIAPSLEFMADDATLEDGVSYTASPTINAGTPDFSWSLVEGPAGMTIDPNTGQVSWISEFAFWSPQPVTVMVENAVGSDTVSWEVTVQPAAPVIDAIADHETLDGLLYEYAATATGTGPLNWVLLDGPEGAAIDPFSGLVAWPADLASGSVRFEIQVEGPGAATDTESWNVTVVGAPPIINPDSVPEQDEVVEVLVGFEYDVLPTLLQGTPPNTWSLEAGPAGMAIDEATGHLSWVAELTGTLVSVGVRVDNVYGHDVISWQLDVKAVAPILEAIEDVRVREGDAYSITPQLSEGSAPLTWTKVAGPAALIVDENTGQVNWVANIAHSPATVTVRVENPEGDDEVTWTITVYPVLEITDPPASRDLYTDDAPITLSATWAGGQNVATYEWIRRRLGVPGTTSYGVEAITASAVSLTLNPADLQPATYQFWVVVTDDGGSVASQWATVRVGHPLEITSNLEDIVLQDGEGYQWSLAATGGIGTRSYQWRASRDDAKAFTDVMDGPFGDGYYDGAKTHTLHFNPFVPEMAGQYLVEVSDENVDKLPVQAGPATVSVDHGLPAGSLLGLAAMALAAAIGGGAALRKRN